MWQIASEIVKLAKQFNANIAIEKLRHVSKCIAEREGIVVKEVKPSCTSQTCPRYGHAGKETGEATSTLNTSSAYMRLIETELQASISASGRPQESQNTEAGLLR